MRTSLFYEHDSFLQRLNPLTKLAFAIGLIVLLTAIVDPITPLVLSAMTLLAVWRLGRVPLGDLARLLLPFLVLLIGLVWTTTLFYVPSPGTHPRALTTLGPFLVTDQALGYALAVGLRLVGFFAASLLFVLTTDPTDLIRALVQQLRLSYRFGYGAHAAYRFVPFFEADLATIRLARRLRGVPEAGGPVARVQQYAGYLVPLLAGAIRRADRVALAMDARGFGAFPDRTAYRRARFGRADLVFALGVVVVYGGALVALHALGWLGQLVPPFLG